ncbi:MAG: hypothetical protein PHR28_01010 [candidate division Zixibacteria bacterium]|nr:hypothetical protein [candidate division Zixibacteria bacterium]
MAKSFDTGGKGFTTLEDGAGAPRDHPGAANIIAPTSTTIIDVVVLIIA